MNSDIEKLYRLAAKEERLIIGLMSGTSMDGLDIALCSCKGSGPETKVKIINFLTVPYNSHFRQEVKAIFSKRDVDLQQVCLLNELIGIRHAEMINQTLKHWEIKATDIDLIASHGQTIFHAPKHLHEITGYPNGTLQIGDGDQIAVNTGIITVSDFRQKHVAAGGEGAPLAVYGDYLVFSEPGKNRIMLNIGGIANFTYLPADGDASKVFSTDVGPGNTLMDQFIQKHYPGLYYDENASVSSAGKVNESLLASLLGNEFFKTGFPKTTGPELFNLDYLLQAQKRSGTEELTNEDVMATLCMFSSRGIADAISSLSGEEKLVIFMSGGGMHNPLVVEYLRALLPAATFKTTADLEINPDAKEAVLFAILANETVAGGSVYFGERQGVPSVCMGKICLPN